MSNQNRNEVVCSSLGKEEDLIFDNIPLLKFSDFVRSLECPKIMRLEAQEKTHRMVEKCKVALSLWRECGFPDLGEWPDKQADLLDFACDRMLETYKNKVNFNNHTVSNSSIVH
ncbi:MAG: hypothetical protein ABR955_12135 [Verrucomicrobiota bacterium]|jgi:hypothetical protein